jgi:nitrogenase-associated protein
MATIVFYEKPGCINNTRQKGLLEAAGHELDVRNLLSTTWSAESLLEFFCGLAVPEWFNYSAPRIKSGEVRPETLTEQSALQLMCADPLLIRRPLMSCAGQRRAGFDQQTIDTWLGLASVDLQQDLETCAKQAVREPCALPEL